MYHKLVSNDYKQLVLYFHRLLKALISTRNARSLEMCPSEAGFCLVSLCSSLWRNCSFIGVQMMSYHDGLLNHLGFEDSA